MTEKISIYIPVYNGARTIAKSINSIFDQSKKFDEVVIVNDCSTDQTLEILKTYSDIKIINNSKNEGLAKSRNIAIKNCKNKLVANIDADIVLDKYWLENILEHLLKNNMIMCGGRTIETNLANIYNKWRSERYPLNWGLTDITNPPFLFGSNSIQDKNLWVNLRGYNENFTSAGDDVDYSRRINQLHNKKISYVSSALSYHLQNDSLESLINRVWRYHSFGYKDVNPSFYRLLKLFIKQLKIFFQRFLKDFLRFNFFFIFINFFILLGFFYFETKRLLIKNS